MNIKELKEMKVQINNIIDSQIQKMEEQIKQEKPNIHDYFYKTGIVDKEFHKLIDKNIYIAKKCYNIIEFMKEEYPYLEFWATREKLTIDVYKHLKREIDSSPELENLLLQAHPYRVEIRNSDRTIFLSTKMMIEEEIEKEVKKHDI